MSKKIEDYREEFYVFTGKASDVNRQLALAGVAIIWIFNNPDGSKILLCDALILPLIFLVVSLAIDLIQYVLGSVIWGIFFEIKEYQVNHQNLLNDNIKAPNILSYSITTLFFLKVITMVLLFDFLKSKI